MSPIEETEEKRPIKDEFADEHILAVINIPWFIDCANYLVGGVIPNDFDYNKKKSFFMIVGCGVTHSYTREE